MGDFRHDASPDEPAGAASITLARAAAEAIRGLNHATRDPAGLGQPSAAYDVLGALSQAASGLPQLTAQITSYLGQALAAGKLGHDRGEDPAMAVSGAVIFLGDARLSAAALAGDLDAAQQQLGPVNGYPAHQEENSGPSGLPPASPTASLPASATPSPASTAGT